MKYPRYPRRLDRRYKLTERQIKYIRDNAKHFLQIDLAAKFGITQPRVWQILNSEKCKKLHRAYYLIHGSTYQKYTAKQRRDIRKRKRTLQLKQIRRYYNIKTKICRRKKRI